MGQLMELFNGEGVAILWLRHSLPSEKDPGSDECEHRADKNGTNSCLEYFQNLY